MMRHLKLLPILLLAACAASGPREVPQAEPAAVGLSAAKLAKVDAVMDGFVRDRKIAGGLVAIAKDGQVVYLKSFGQMDRESGRPVQADTIWRLYSMTKAIVTAASLILVEEGKIALDDPVSKHVPELAEVKVLTAEGPRTPARPPTVKDLMLHTAGYGYGGNPPAVQKAYREKKPLEAKDLDDMAERLKDVPLAFDPGMDWLYSVSIDVLGLVVQRASKTPLDRFLQERIFGPLDMRDAGFTVPPEKLDRFAANYQRAGGDLKLIDAPKESKYARPVSFHSGGGGLVGTARDYLRFLLMIEGGGSLHGTRILQPETVKLMTTNQLPPKAFPIYFGKEIRHATGFGLGFSVRTADSAWDPQARVGEYGWGGAASTHYWVSPKDRLVVVTLEQTMPYTFDTEFAVKGLIYDALAK
jgi:CubicO group peptidase (beta-lactamase class C family)